MRASSGSPPHSAHRARRTVTVGVIDVLHLLARELVQLLDSAAGTDDLEPGAVLVVELAGDAPGGEELTRLATRLTPLAAVVLGVAETPVTGDWAPLCDAAFEAGSDDLELAEKMATTHPAAATTLALLLRGASRHDTEAGLVAESLAYSTLQSGPEFRAWRASRPVRTRPSPPQSSVVVERSGDQLVLTLNRPEVRNALDRGMRDQLVAALAIAEADPSIHRVVLRGTGPTFCSGGDLDEFGTFPDPATAHLLRLARSPALSISRVAGRLEAQVHGTCYGSGVELAAFAGRVLAHPATTFALPELALGLVPGAGGTVSLPRRIGRHRTAWLALTGESIDAPTARDWGLVDEIGPTPA